MLTYRLIFKGLRLSLEEYAGARIAHGSSSLCIDVINYTGCDYILYNHHHKRHAPQSIDESILDKVISPSIGLKVKPGDSIDLGGVINVSVIEAYNRFRPQALHYRGLGVGYIVRFGNISVYHMGDTDLIEEILEIKDRIDILLVPIGGENVMNAEEASEAIKSLRPTIAIPIHFDNLKVFYKFRDISQPYTQVILLRGKYSV